MFGSESGYDVDFLSLKQQLDMLRDAFDELPDHRTGKSWNSLLSFMFQQLELVLPLPDCCQI